jgi:hypothetical protein
MEQYKKDMEAKGFDIVSLSTITTNAADEIFCEAEAIESVSISTDGNSLVYETSFNERILFSLDTVQRLIYDYNRLVIEPSRAKQADDLMAKIKEQHPAPDKDKFISEMRTANGY